MNNVIFSRIFISFIVFSLKCDINGIPCSHIIFYYCWNWNSADGGSGESLRQTFRTIVQESDDGIANLFRGWFERALYLGIGRAWLEPLQIVGYIAIRDAILLEWFD